MVAQRRRPAFRQNVVGGRGKWHKEVLDGQSCNDFRVFLLEGLKQKVSKKGTENILFSGSKSLR